MDDAESEVLLQLHEKAYHTFSDFMTRITKFEELVSIGSSLLVGFHHQLGETVARNALPRSPLDKTSKMVDAITKANETERMKAYLKDGCVTIHDGVQMISKSRSLLNELECLVDDMIDIVEITNECKSHFCVKHSGDGLIHEKEEMELVHLKKHEVSDYAAMTGILYSMLKQDYTMQEKIVSSLKLSSLLGELGSYCLMWSLRPYINEDTMHRAWRLIR